MREKEKKRGSQLPSVALALHAAEFSARPSAPGCDGTSSAASRGRLFPSAEKNGGFSFRNVFTSRQSEEEEEGGSVTALFST